MPQNTAGTGYFLKQSYFEFSNITMHLRSCISSSNYHQKPFNRGFRATRDSKLNHSDVHTSPLKTDFLFILCAEIFLDF